MTRCCTHTKTYTLMDAWASTLPLAVDRVKPCNTGPVVGDGCAVEDCDYSLRAGEECYSVTQLPEVDGRNQWVCWRHVQPDRGPITVP